MSSKEARNKTFAMMRDLPFPLLAAFLRDSISAFQKQENVGQCHKPQHVVIKNISASPNCNKAMENQQRTANQSLHNGECVPATHFSDMFGNC